jgi:hypothetical protein
LLSRELVVEYFIDARRYEHLADFWMLRPLHEVVATAATDTSGFRLIHNDNSRLL